MSKPKVPSSFPRILTDGKVRYTEELNHALMDEDFVQACLTTVVICGSPVTKQFIATDPSATISNFNERKDWLDAVEKLCLERFKMDYGNIGDFITVFEIWWQEQNGELDTDEAIANVVIGRG